MYLCMYIRMYVYMYYLMFSNQSTGGWSTEGIIQDNNPTLPVLCNTTHLTSFCILVSTEVNQVCV